MAVVLLSEFPFAPRRFLIPTSCATMFETRNSRAAIIVVRMVLEQEEQVLLLIKLFSRKMNLNNLIPIPRT